MGCFKCGVSEDKTRLFDAISSQGIIKVCSQCSFEEDIPVIRKPTTFQLKEAERKPGVYEKMSKASGVSLARAVVQKQDMTLREIVDKNYQKRVKTEAKPRPDLIENFHWVIMRARRSKKITQTQLAREIQESEVVIKMAEQGILPEDDNKLVSKIESYLGINITKRIKPDQPLVEETEIEIIEKEVPTDLAFDPLSAKNLTIEDIKGMNKKREFGLFGTREPTPIEKEVLEEAEELEEAIEQVGEDKELTDEEIDDIIFGRK